MYPCSQEEYGLEATSCTSAFLRPSAIGHYKALNYDAGSLSIDSVMVVAR